MFPHWSNAMNVSTKFVYSQRVKLIRSEVHPNEKIVPEKLNDIVVLLRRQVPASWLLTNRTVCVWHKLKRENMYAAGREQKNRQSPWREYLSHESWCVPPICFFHRAPLSLSLTNGCVDDSTISAWNERRAEVLHECSWILAATRWWQTWIPGVIPFGWVQPGHGLSRMPKMHGSGCLRTAWSHGQVSQYSEPGATRKAPSRSLRAPAV